MTARPRGSRPQHFLVTTTTANSTATLEHLEFHLQSTCADLDVLLTDVGDQWAQFALAGPRAREVLARVVSDLDLVNAAFPFMAASAATIAGIPGRLFRISFSGELAYEVAVPGKPRAHARGRRCSRPASLSASAPTDSMRSTRCGSRKATSRAPSSTVTPAPMILGLQRC